MTEIVSPLKWHGGKHYLARTIVALMPPHLHYVEPFAGGLHVLLTRDPADRRLWVADDSGHRGVSEVANDLHGPLTNFWRVVRDPDLFGLFVRAVEAVPFSEAEWREAHAHEYGQAAMRHADIRLTMGVYTDPKLLDVRGALDALPGLTLGEGQAEGEAVRATGTHGAARMVAPTPDNLRTTPSFPGNPASGGVLNTLAVSGSVDKRKGPLTSPVSEPFSRGERIRTSDLLNPIQEPTNRKPLLHQADTATYSFGCTSRCTGEAKTEQTDMLAALAAALLGLSPEDRARLAALLVGDQTGKPVE